MVKYYQRTKCGKVLPTHITWNSNAYSQNMEKYCLLTEYGIVLYLQVAKSLYCLLAEHGTVMLTHRIWSCTIPTHRIRKSTTYSQNLEENKEKYCLNTEYRKEL